MTLNTNRSKRLFSSDHSDARFILLEHQTKENNSDMTITTLTLNRPKANAWSQSMLKQFKECLHEMKMSSSRCLVLTSALPKVFSAGADLKERASMTPEEAEIFVADLRNTFQDVAELPMPVLACIGEGAALGGGLELALAADIRIASPRCRLGLVETSLAIIPGAGGTQRLSRLIGPGRALDWILSARIRTGTEASDVIEHVTDKPFDFAMELAWKMAENGPIAMRAAKRAVNADLQLKEGLELERQCYAETLPTQDRLEGLAAFREGRKPDYKGN